MISLVCLIPIHYGHSADAAGLENERTRETPGGEDQAVGAMDVLARVDSHLGMLGDASWWRLREGVALVLAGVSPHRAANHHGVIC